MSGPVTSRVVSMSMNRASSSATIVLVNGSVATMPLEPTPFEPSSQLAQITVIPNAALLHLLTTRGDHVAAELANRWDPAPLGGRPVLYLDQNIWSTLFRRIHDADRIDNADEADAAEQLIDLALNRRVIVPYSAAHMSETTQWADRDQRYRLALTILQLSGGWQMRDALEVRCRELWAHLALRYRAYCVLPRPVFTLEPDTIHSGIRRDPGGTTGLSRRCCVATPVHGLDARELRHDAQCGVDSARGGRSVGGRPTELHGLARR